jgi:hypothetical protein
MMTTVMSVLSLDMRKRARAMGKTLMAWEDGVKTYDISDELERVKEELKQEIAKKLAWANSEISLRVKYEEEASEISNRCDTITEATDNNSIKQAAISQNNRTLDILYRVYMKQLRELRKAEEGESNG